MLRIFFLCGVLLTMGFCQINYIHQPVAAIDDPLAIKFNPAGLAMYNHSESLTFGNIGASELQKNFAYFNQNGPVGFGYEWDTKSRLNH